MMNLQDIFTIQGVFKKETRWQSMIRFLSRKPRPLQEFRVTGLFP